jgi:hypothetical protein
VTRERFWRDASGRLTVDQTGIESSQYPAVCLALADAFGLTPDGDFVVGLEQIFWDFRRGEQKVGMDWDIWMEFMVVAKTPSAEPLVCEIGAWLDANRSPGPGKFERNPR